MEKNATRIIVKYPHQFSFAKCSQTCCSSVVLQKAVTVMQQFVLQYSSRFISIIAGNSLFICSLSLSFWGWQKFEKVYSIISFHTL
ncbi:hypothetical protein AB205_0160350 [Aquarana catesbeiana]|uniref:Uncharacterized protein n=1 Tax=Aquarana catesbeiana TaxID=8400 RepID=A0A2G9RQG0_AQUCT|nr:hypothetical protein AB205_0160350 [Aquarana catesbeiana]